MKRSDILKYLVDEYFNGNPENVRNVTGYTIQQIQSWLSGERQPQKQTVEYFIHCALAPEFKVVVEFAHFKPEEDLRPQLRTALGTHESRPGIYAFYDSMAKLLYVGKAANLLEEMYQQLRQAIVIEFPRGVQKTPEKRYEVVRYVSAYDVGESDWVDYPKHVESLILRISKPPLNQRIGYLERLQTTSDD